MRNRQAAVIFIFITVTLDMLAPGLVGNSGKHAQPMTPEPSNSAFSPSCCKCDHTFHQI
jgi:hypothetical protein